MDKSIMIKNRTPILFQSLGMGRPVKKGFGRNRLLLLVFGVFTIGVLLIMVNIYELRMMQSSHLALHGGVMVEGSLDGVDGGFRPKVWVAGKRLDSGYLSHVFAVFSRVGYVRNNGGLDGLDWDVMWSHDYPFSQFSTHLTNLKPYQKVNHFPGSGFITNKVSLATSDIMHIPKAFKIPKQKEEFLKYSKLNPDQLWVQKSNNHRGIKIKSLKELDLVSDNTFIQEYVDEPFLIDGHRFDIGIYTALASINPLRVYVFNNDWLIRFCPDEYYPFDPTVINKYVVTDDYKPPWDIPSMAKYFTTEDISRRESLFMVLEEQGLDAKKLEADLFESIISVYLEKEKALIKACEKYPSSRHFFEMVRFDFVLDKNLNVYLMEVNMSPNLSSGHFAPNKMMYEQVIFGLFNLVGVARPVRSDFVRSNTDEANMQVSSKDIHVYTDQCASETCKNNCGPQMCKFCKPCLQSENQLTLKAAHQEHVNRHGFQRIFPRTFESQSAAEEWQYSEDDSFSSLNTANQWMTLWFRGKCLLDPEWCP